MTVRRRTIATLAAALLAAGAAVASGPAGSPAAAASGSPANTPHWAVGAVTAAAPALNRAAVAAGGTASSGPSTTMFGSNAWTGDGSTYSEALARQERAYGELEVVRTFHSGLPHAWPGNAGLSGGPVVVSFKARPQEINSGRYDSFFKDWFAKAPRDRLVYWTFWHEPEDDIEDGAFTYADYRNAYRRLDGLADRAANPRLKTTTIWMCWTLKAKNRNWKNYYPGADVVDVMGWDCYNRGAQKRTPVYTPPADMLGLLVSTSKAQGKPFGLGEFGSQKLASDPTGSQRAAWLKASATYLRSSGAGFVAYFDAYGGNVANPEYRLLDANSRAAWRWVVSGS